MALSQLGLLPNLLITGLGTSRIAIGAGSVLTPQFTASLFGVPLAAESAVLVRLFGARELVFGALAVRARNIFVQSSSPAPKGEAGVAWREQGRRDLKGLLLIGILIDVIDVGSSLVGIYKGDLGLEAAGWVGGGALAAVVMGVLGLRGL